MSNKEYPKIWKDIEILYNGEWYGGYWEGNEWRVYLKDGRDDFITDDEIEDWREIGRREADDDVSS